jgi:hypothetical protein
MNFQGSARDKILSRQIADDRDLFVALAWLFQTLRGSEVQEDLTVSLACC